MSAGSRPRGQSGEPIDSGPDVEWRVAALETAFARMDAKVDKLDVKVDRLIEVVRDFGVKAAERMNVIENRLTAIEAKLDAKADKSDLIGIEGRLGTLDGKVSNLPTFWQTLTILATLLVGMAGLAFTLGKLVH